MRSRRRVVILTAVAVVALALAIGGVSVALAGSSETLPPISAEELLTKMARADAQGQSVSGEISWDNGLFGSIDVPGDLAQMPAQSPLLSSGSGRIWVSEAGMRVESQGSGGDQVAAVSASSRVAWTYESATNTANRYELSDDELVTPMPSPAVTATLAPVVISTYLERLAPYATVEVAGQTTVAGRSSYLLRMTPVANDTALGLVQAAVDGETMLPLRLEVFARGAAEPVLRFGFDSISYESIDPSLYEFTAPDGAEVTTEVIDPEKAHAESEDTGRRAHGQADKAERAKLARRALLTVDQAQELVGYNLARARDYDARSFRWAYVFGGGGPLTAAGEPLFDMAGIEQPASTEPSSVLLYGSGFGAITLAQTKTTAELTEQLERLPVLGQATAGGATERSVFTPLGGVVIWQQDGTTLLAGGMVTQADLEDFVRTVR